MMLKWIKKIRSEMLNLDQLDYNKVNEYLKKFKSLKKKVEYCLDLFEEKV